MIKISPGNACYLFLFVYLCIVGLLAIKVTFDHLELWHTPVPAADPLSTVQLKDGSSYRWLTKLWCEDGEFSRLCYHHPEESNLRGHPFSRQTLRLLNKLQIFDYTARYVEPEKYLKGNNPVFLTAADSQYFGALKVAIRSVQEHFPNSTIIFYDLGMDEHQVAELKSFCNLEYVRFPFEDFPSYFRELRQYRWKPVIIAKTLATHGAVWYMDSSARFTTSNLKGLYDLFARTSNTTNEERKFSFLLHSSAKHGIYSTTSPMTYVFVPTNLTKMKLLRPTCMEANLMLILRTRETVEAILLWLVACALEENCMSTPEAKLYCKFKPDPFNDYANCHRYDQAVTNLLLANHLGYKSKRWSSEHNFFVIRRWQSDDNYLPYTCPRNTIVSAKPQ